MKKLSRHPRRKKRINKSQIQTTVAAMIQKQRKKWPTS